MLAKKINSYLKGFFFSLNSAKLKWEIIKLSNFDSFIILSIVLFPIFIMLIFFIVLVEYIQFISFHTCGVYYGRKTALFY